MFESRALIVEFEERQCAMCRSRLSFMRGVIAAGNAARREVIVSRGGRQVSGISEEDIEELFVVPWAGFGDQMMCTSRVMGMESWRICIVLIFKSNFFYHDKVRYTLWRSSNPQKRPHFQPSPPTRT